MITKILGEQPFQVLTNNFSISPSNEGYTLQISADGKNFSNLFSVGAGVTRLVTGVAANSYYRLLGNQSQVSVNWMKTCVTEGGGGAGNELIPQETLPEYADAGTVVALADGGVYQYDGTDWIPVGLDDMSAYWTSAETKTYVDSADTAIYASAASYADAAVAAIDLSEFVTSADVKSQVEAYNYITSADAKSQIEAYNYVNSGDVETQIVGKNYITSADAETQIAEALAPYYTSAQTDSAIAAAVAPYYTSAQTDTKIADAVAPFWNSADTKDYVDSAITGVEERMDDVELVAASAITDLNTRVSAISANTPDLSNYALSADVTSLSAATAGKADAAYVSGNSDMRFPKWNQQGIITGLDETSLYYKELTVNGLGNRIVRAGNIELPSFYAPVSAGTAGDILVSTGSGAPVWSAVTFPTPDVNKAYVDSAITGVQAQLDVIDQVIPAAIVDLQNNKVGSTSISTIWEGTQAEYDAETNSGATASPTTFYIIIPNSNS